MSIKTRPEYDHTQKGVIQPILLALAAICLVIAVATRHSPPYLTVFLITSIVCIVLSFAHRYLAVCDGGDRLAVRFGPLPLFKKTIPYAEITAVEQDRSSFLAGWGIHWTRKGWLWNIGGFDCVRIHKGRSST